MSCPDVQHRGRLTRGFADKGYPLRPSVTFSPERQALLCSGTIVLPGIGFYNAKK